MIGIAIAVLLMAMAAPLVAGIVAVYAVYKIQMNIADETNIAMRRGGYIANAGNRTYIYMGDQINPLEIARRLPGWIPARAGARSADLVMASGIALSDRRLFAIKAGMKCRMDAKALTDKTRFHSAMKEIAPELIAPTIDVLGDTIQPEGTIWMVRANWGFGGHASAVATDTAELQGLRTKFIETNTTRMTPRVIASEYIMDPMLYDGYKFHLRVYLLITDIRGVKTVSMLRNGLIIPAHKPYVAANWDDAEIHDTHGRDNVGLGRFPRDLHNGSEIAVRVADALRRAILPFLDDIKRYPESPAAYEMLGADIMLREDGTPVIIEINDGPGLTWLQVHPEGAEAGQEIIDWLFATTVYKMWPIDAAAIESCAAIEL